MHVLADKVIPLVDFGFTFNEIPDKFAFYLEMGECMQGCPCCHSPELQEDLKMKSSILEIRELAEQAIDDGANAIVVMGGTTSKNLDKGTLVRLLQELSCVAPVCLYSGRNAEWEDKRIADAGDCTWLKTGSYIDALGGLESPRTNQRFFQREYVQYTDSYNDYLVDIRKVWVDNTHKFWKKVKHVT